MFSFDILEDGSVRLTVRDAEGHILRRVQRAVGTQEACQMLSRSRRHLYRYIKRGWLQPAAKFAGELFFDAVDIQSIGAKNGSGRRRSLPPSMALLFPEYDLRTLEYRRDADLVLSRVLERGSAKEIRWALGRYSRKNRISFMIRQGHRLLSARAYHFWSWLWRIPSHHRRSVWRAAGRRWGGVA